MSDEREYIAQRLRELEADPAYRDHPLMAELRWLGQRYFKVERQLRKVSRIGDLLQGLLREDNAAFEQAALTDALTELPNRRAMLDKLEAEANRAEREGGCLVVGMGDVDHFKVINDTHGHDAGDTVLRELAARLQEGLRDYDHCARWGGEEFLILLPGVRGAKGFEAAERLRRAVAEQPVPWEGLSLPVTLSFGLAMMHPGEDLEGLLGRVDVALYQAKRQGRNRTVVAAEDSAYFRDSG